MKGYGQFCPVAKAMEVLGERWTLLIVRELLMGCRRFNEIRRGVPLISPSLLAQRLRTLEQMGVVRRDAGDDSRVVEYRLTEAGNELLPLVELAGHWGSRWVRSNLADEDLDASLLMWDMRRRIRTEAFPLSRGCVHFHYTDAKAGLQHWWLLVDGDDVDLCLEDPGREPDLDVVTDVRTMTGVWTGDLSLDTALRGDRIRIYGPSRLRSSLRRWLGLSVFADVRPAVAPRFEI